MDEGQKQIVINMLVGFVVRVSSGNATTEEVSVLPEIAKLLLTTNI